MHPLKSPEKWHIALALVAGIFAISTSAIFIRLAIDAAGTRGVAFSLFLAASRLTLASLLLLPVGFRLKSQKISRQAVLFAVIAGACLALHFATWITSLSFTSIAASTTLVTTNPIWIALISWLWFGEKPTKMARIGIAIALCGGILIALGGGTADNTATNPLLGNVLALIGAWMVSLYILCGREAQRKGLGTGGYAIIAYSTSALLLFPFPLLFGSGYLNYPQPVYLYIILIALIPQLIGHTSLNWSVRWVSPIFISLAILFEPVGSSLLGFIFFKEIPGLPVLAGAAILLSGVATAIWGSR
ncbi:DMT family transporter [Lusitaniella coriacea]|uniref:DMT family transporter n=1 Tax=Lusitaniella coriacea TaxID=1983105 RepID=UPI003CF51734